MDYLSKNILSTVVYYDILDYPLTAFEVWKYLTTAGGKSENVRLGSIIEALESPILSEMIETEGGLYFLRGRRKLVEERVARNKISQRKIKLAIKVVRALRFVPFVRMIALTGRVAMKNAQPRSDLDFFIVLEEGKIFIGRLLVTLATHLLGKRRYADKITDRACLNYFITSDALEIKLKDIYSSSEYSFIYPLFGKEIFARFQRENFWIADFKPNFVSDEISNVKAVEDSDLSKAVRRYGEILFSFGWIENLLRKWQMKRIGKDPRTHQKGSAVMANNDSLVFLPDPHGPKIYDKYREKMEELS